MDKTEKLFDLLGGLIPQAVKYQDVNYRDDTRQVGFVIRLTETDHLTVEFWINKTHIELDIRRVERTKRKLWFDKFNETKVRIPFYSDYGRSISMDFIDYALDVYSNIRLKDANNMMESCVASTPEDDIYSAKDITKQRAVDEIKNQLIKNVEDSRND